MSPSFVNPVLFHPLQITATAKGKNTSTSIIDQWTIDYFHFCMFSSTSHHHLSLCRRSVWFIWPIYLFFSLCQYNHLTFSLLCLLFRLSLSLSGVLTSFIGIYISPHTHYTVIFIVAKSKITKAEMFVYSVQAHMLEVFFSVLNSSLWQNYSAIYWSGVCTTSFFVYADISWDDALFTDFLLEQRKKKIG